MNKKLNMNFTPDCGLLLVHFVRLGFPSMSNCWLSDVNIHPYTQKTIGNNGRTITNNIFIKPVVLQSFPVVSVMTFYL